MTVAGLLEWVSPALAAASLLVAVLIVALARRSIAAVALATYLAAWGAANLQVTILGELGFGDAFVLKLGWSIQVVSWAAVLVFAVVYPNVHLSRGRRAAVWVIVVAAAAGAINILMSRDVPGYAGVVLGTFGEALPMAILGLRWLTRGPDAYRTQLAWGILPIAWWTLHDVLGHVVYPWLLEGGPAPGSGNPLLIPFIVFNVAGVVFTLVLASVALGRVVRGRAAGDDRALGFVLLYMVPLTLVQVLVPGSSRPLLSTHILLDYAVVPLAVYGVLRHRVVDIDIKIKHGLKRSTVAGAFVAVFLIAMTITQEFLAESMGWLFGGLAAGILVFALGPLQRFAERLSTAAFPTAADDPAYLAYRRFQIYRAALEGTVHDGVLDPSETSALRRLRGELGLTLNDHRLLETEVRQGIAAVSP